MKNVKNPPKNYQKNRKTTIDSPSLTFMYTNADSVTNKLQEIQAMIEIYKPDIIGITEIKPKNLKYALTKNQFKMEN